MGITWISIVSRICIKSMRDIWTTSLDLPSLMFYSNSNYSYGARSKEANSRKNTLLQPLGMSITASMGKSIKDANTHTPSSILPCSDMGTIQETHCHLLLSTQDKGINTPFPEGDSSDILTPTGSDSCHFRATRIVGARNDRTQLSNYNGHQTGVHLMSTQLPNRIGP